MLCLIWKGNSYISGVKPCFKILVSAVGGTKNFFKNTNIWLKWFLLSSGFLGLAKEDFQILTSKKLITINETER